MSRSNTGPELLLPNNYLLWVTESAGKNVFQASSFALCYVSLEMCVFAQMKETLCTKIIIALLSILEVPDLETIL